MSVGIKNMCVVIIYALVSFLHVRYEFPVYISMFVGNILCETLMVTVDDSKLPQCAITEATPSFSLSTQNWVEFITRAYNPHIAIVTHIWS